VASGFLSAKYCLSLHIGQLNTQSLIDESIMTTLSQRGFCINRLIVQCTMHNYSVGWRSFTIVTDKPVKHSILTH